jgi:hypothetical protein
MTRTLARSALLAVMCRPGLAVAAVKNVVFKAKFKAIRQAPA